MSPIKPDPVSIYLRRACEESWSVFQLVSAGVKVDEVLLWMVRQEARLRQRITELEQVAPRKYVLDDGRVLIWRCPDEFIPVVPFPGTDTAGEENTSS